MALDRTRIVKYEKLRLLGKNKTQAALGAGYTLSSATSGKLEKSAGYKSVHEETQAAARELSVTPATVLSTLKRAMDRSKTSDKHDATSIAAAKAAGDFLGMQQPQVIQTEVITKHQVLLSVLEAVRKPAHADYTLVDSEGGQDG